VAEAGPGAETTSELARRVRDCAVTGGQLVGNADPERARLGEAVRTLLTAYAEALTGPQRAAAALSDSGRWPADHPELFEALLQTGRAAASVGGEGELRLALRITDTMLAVRPKSRAGWRLRARVLEALGDDVGAVQAHERYLKLCTVDDLGIGARITGLRESRARLTECVRLLQERHPAPRAAASRPATEQWDTGLALWERGDAAAAAGRLTAALAELAAAGCPLNQLSAALATIIDIELELDAVAAGGAPRRDLFEAFAEHRRLLAREPAPDPLLGGATVIAVSDFRNLIAGKSICLVANSQRVADGRMGKEIDAYDLVVRFNSFKLNPPATGRRTDIHATIHKHNFNWEVPVTTRLVFGGKQGVWQQSLRRRLVPGAQRYVNDRTLRWPARELGKLSVTQWPAIPTSGFNMLWLLDYLDVSPRLDLIGFDFYTSGAYRLSGAMKLPIADVHAYQQERDWVKARARHTDEMRTALR
jgi:hypothetical protein